MNFSFARRPAASGRTAPKRAPSRHAPRPLEHVTTRIVLDRRWVHRDRLEVGMYVGELDRPWSETRFLFQGFRIETEKMLDEVREACEHACVETEKLARISSHSTTRLVGTPFGH